MQSDDFSAAAGAFASLVATIDDDQWSGPGLGEWTVRDLVGHTSRSLTTVETYLGVAPEPGASLIDDPVEYLMALGSGAVDPASVAQRGRDAGAALGADPAAAVGVLADRVIALVAATPGDAGLTTLFGAMTLRAYLPTRIFELTVHTLDLAAALGVDPPAGLDGPLASTLALVSAVVCSSGTGPVVLRALTGRGPLPLGFSVV